MENQKQALIIDEQHVAGLIASDSLRRAGHSVTMSEKVNSALGFLRSNTFDTVFINLRHCQDCDRLRRRFLRLIKQARGANHIVCCVAGPSALSAHIKRRGALVIRKPFTSADMDALVSSSLKP